MKTKTISLYITSIILLSCAEEKTRKVEPLDHIYRSRAYTYLRDNKADSAFFYFNLAGDQYRDAKDSLNTANCLIQMAIILSNQGDYFGSQETSLQANGYLDERKPEHHSYLSSNFNNLGVSTHRLKDYQSALKFYESAIQFSTDSASTQMYLNNKAKTLQQKKDYAAALEIYKEILTKSVGTPLGYARALTNYTVTRWAADPNYDAYPELSRALHIRQRENGLWGQNSSYTHLADYYTKNHPDSALYYARKRYAVAKTLRSGEDLAHALQKLIEVGTTDSVKQYFEAYRQLNDSIQLARSAAKNQFALIRYEVEKNKAENLRLQHENAQKVYQVNRQRVWTSAVVALAVILLTGGIYWYKKRKQRLELEAQNRIKAHQLKTSKKVHDVVANGLYRVMAEVENKSDINRDRILDQLEEIYEKSRDISYETEIPSQRQIDYHRNITDLLTSFATDSTKVIIAGNDPEVWEGVSPQARQELAHILQELMVNMRKHSQARNVAVRFDRQNNQLMVYYTDNGVGVPQGMKYGNGLTNTGNRIESLGGILTFDSTVGKGLKIQISFAVI